MAPFFRSIAAMHTQEPFAGEGDLLDSLAYEVVTQLGPLGIFDGSGGGPGGAAAAAAADGNTSATALARELLSQPLFVRQMLESVAGALNGDEARTSAWPLAGSLA